MKKNDWKKRDGIVYSTDSTFEYKHGGSDEAETLPSGKQELRVSLDKTGRAGKIVTLISGFIGKTNDLELLAKTLKTKCATGGSASDGQVLIQGDKREKVMQVLSSLGYKVKRVGG